jgi:hypothetical protein
MEGDKMEKYILDLSDYLERYPQGKFESLEDYKYRINDNLYIDYKLQADTRGKLLKVMFKSMDI